MGQNDTYEYYRLFGVSKRRIFPAGEQKAVREDANGDIILLTFAGSFFIFNGTVSKNRFKRSLCL